MESMLLISKLGLNHGEEPLKTVIAVIIGIAIIVTTAIDIIVTNITIIVTTAIDIIAIIVTNMMVIVQDAVPIVDLIEAAF